MKRREFIATLNSAMLLGLAGAIPGLSFYSRGAFGQTAPKRFFVLIRMQGGWDVTLGLDPQIQASGNDANDMYIEYRAEEIISAGNLRLAPAAAPLAPHAANLAIINGVFMSDSNQSHDSNLDYISTGDQMGKSADLSVEIANATFAGPYGVIFNQNVKRASRSTMLSTTSNIQSLQNSMDLDSLKKVILNASGTSDFARSRATLLNTQENRTRLLAAMETLKAQMSASANGAASVVPAAAIIAACFVSQTAFQAQLDVQTTLDTHSSHPSTHLKGQKEGWEAIAQVMQLFKDTPCPDPSGALLGSLFDNTTFMVVSEFSRTPALNSAQGKDHNPFTNSVLLAGSGIRGGQMIGQSELIPRRLSQTGQSRHVGGLIDYGTGRAARSKSEARASNFQFIFPENVAATVAVIQGVDRAKFSSVGSAVQPLSTLIKV